MKKRGEEQGGVGKSSRVMGQMEWISRLIPEPTELGGPSSLRHWENKKGLGRPSEIKLASRAALT